MKKHFAAEKPPTPPPAVIRGLYEHTCQIAELQGKEVADVAAAAVIGAILPREWTPKMAAKTLAICENFVQNLAVAPGHRVGDEPREYNLIDELNSCFEATSEEQFVVRCQEVQTNRPIMARKAEMRYHDTLRSKVNEIGINLW